MGNVAGNIVTLISTHVGTDYGFIGAYISNPAATYSALPKLIECPYCYRPLVRIHATVLARVREIVGPRPDGRVDVLAEPVPSTHRVLGCEDCENFFTLPPEAYHG